MSQKQVRAKRRLHEAACGKMPAITMAEEGEILDVLSHNPNYSLWSYHLQDVNKERPPFYAHKEDMEEVEHEIEYNI